MKPYLFAFISIFLFSYASQACDVYNYKDAIDCITDDAYERYSVGEQRHSVGATRTAHGKRDFKIMTGVDAKTTYVGVAEVHYDEDQILYYVVNRGSDVVAELVAEYNLSDLYSDVPALIDMEDEEAQTVMGLHIPLVDSMEDFHN